MIEFRHRRGTQWETLDPIGILLVRRHPKTQFKNNKFRIAGKVYTAYSQEFVDAFNLQCTWDALTG